MKFNKNIILGFILFIAVFLRFYLLSSVPPSASLDEATIGWNAYSILQTGKDEYGKSFPIILRAYDDYRPALYVYTVIPFIKIFGLNAFAVRLPSVILSVLTVFATYFLVKEAFKKQNIINNEYLSLVCAFLLSISPWHIYMSRLGHEVNLAFSAFIFAMVFFLRRNIYLSALFFLISFISYQTEKIFAPLMLLGILIIYNKELLKFKKKILISVVLSFFILIPFFMETFSQNGLVRFSATNVFEANKSRYIDQSILLEKAVGEKDILGQVIYNRRILTAQIFFEGYLSHFNPVWLFTNSSDDSHKIPSIGLFYWWILPFILIGLYNFISKGFDKGIKKVILIWFLIAPISASITTQSPHALRSLIFLPTWQIFSSLGIMYAFYYFKSKNENLSKAFVALMSILIFFSVTYLFKQYFYVFPQVQSKSFQYSLSRAIPYVVSVEKNYGKIVFGNSFDLSQSYMFFLFYTKYDPKLYQNQGGTASGGYDAVHEIGKYEFRPIDLTKEKGESLIIGNYSQFNLTDGIALKPSALKYFDNLDGRRSLEAIVR